MLTADVHASDTAVLPRYLDVGYRKIDRGGGVWLYDAVGEAILDACSGGAMTACLGHGPSPIADAAAAQAEHVPYVYEHFFSNEPRELLAARMVDLVAPAMGRVRFCTGGSEANEMALRMARSYHVERGDSARWRIISPAQAYHGATLGALALSGRSSLKGALDRYLPAHLHLSPLSYRQDSTGEAALAELDRVIEEAGPESVAAFFCEPVSGAAMPGYCPPAAFWEGLDERRREHGFLVCFDEIVTGIGRTGSWLAADRLPIEPDIVSVGKGLGAGYAPLTAVLCREEVYAAFEQGSKAFEHGHTWDGAPLPCAAGLAVLDEIVERGLLDRVAMRGPSLLEELRYAVDELDLVSDVRGRGFLLGIELVDPRDGARVLPPEVDAAMQLDLLALERGLLVSSSHASADGVVGDQVVFAPAFTASDAELAEMVARLATTLSELQARLVRELGP
ncbi:MAG: aspartate aminotransferase family protein [Solirubrobacterales bacterium]